PRPRPRPPRHSPPPTRPRPRETYLPLLRPRLPVDGRERRSGEGHSRL
ncbi:uncharacterized protein METZ01_LOCUS516749, partial [marine metagenome]